jgi:two-component system response regulator (stage 0 sporulation protein A)
MKKYVFNEKKETLYVTDLLHNFGIPAHIKGFQYLRSIILEVLKDPTLLNAITTRIYPLISEMYDTTSSRVERALRHAIETAWIHGDIAIIDEYFKGVTTFRNRKNSKGCPSNSEFIALICDNIRIGIR